MCACRVSEGVRACVACRILQLGSAGVAIELFLHGLQRLGDRHEQVGCFLVKPPGKLMAFEGKPQRLLH